MKKQISKSKGMSTFKKLSLGNMICGYLTIAAVLAMVIFALISRNTNRTGNLEFLVIGVLAALIIATGTLGIAQAVEGRHYGDVFGKMTRRNVTIMITVFMVACVGCAAIAGILNEGVHEQWGEYLEYVFVGLTALAFIGHTITSTLIVAKAK